MPPTLILVDVHSSPFWKTAVAQNPGCRCIFLGDYLDPYETVTQDKLLQNLQEIIQFKKDNPDNVILLLGNHDLHYFTADRELSSRFDFLIAEQLNKPEQIEALCRCGTSRGGLRGTVGGIFWADVNELFKSRILTTVCKEAV
jgi:predicted MPP superfamily phosphohydrolase